MISALHCWTLPCDLGIHFLINVVMLYIILMHISYFVFFFFLLMTYCAYMVTQSCPTLCSPMDCSPPNSSVRGVFQARILEWVVISSTRGSSDSGIKSASPVSPAFLADSLPKEPSGKPNELLLSVYCICILHYEKNVREKANSSDFLIGIQNGS